MDSQLIYVRNYEGLPGAWFKAVPNKPGCYERIVYRREGRCKRKSKECRDKMRTAVEHSRKQGQRVKLVVCPCCVPEEDSEPSLPSDFPISEERPTLKPFFTDSDSEESQKDPGVFDTMKCKVVGMFKHLFGCLVPGACCLDEEELEA